MKPFNSVILNYTFKAKDLFIDFDVENIKTSTKVLHKKYSTTFSKRILICKAFIYFLYIVIFDVIENNIIFEFPTPRPLYLVLKTIQGDALVKCMKKGYTDKYDLMASNYKLKHICFVYRKKNGTFVHKSMSVDKELTNMLYENVNNCKYG